MKKRANNFLNKCLARSITVELTKNSPDMSTLFTRLLTLENQEASQLKTEAARMRLREAMKSITDGVKYGWSFGISGHELRVAALKPKHTDRKVRFLTAIAIKSGLAIGDAQLQKVRKNQGTALRHTHAAKFNPTIQQTAQ